MAQSSIKAVESGDESSPRCLNNLHTLETENMRKEWGKELWKLGRSRLLPELPFRQMPFVNMSRWLASLLPARVLFPAHFRVPVWVSVWCEREKWLAALYSGHWFAPPFIFVSPSYPGSWKCTHHLNTQHNFKDRGNVTLMGFYASFRRNRVPYTFYLVSLRFHWSLCLDGV